MPSSGPDRHVAYLEDADDGTGSCIEGTRKYARNDEATVTAPPPPRQKPNVGRLITDPPLSTRRSPPSAARAESDSNPSSARDSDRGRDSDAQKPRRPSSKTRRQSQQSDPDRERRRQERIARDYEERSAKHEQPSRAGKEASNPRKVRPAVLEHSASQPAVPQAEQRRRASGADEPQRPYEHPSGAHPTRPRAQTRPATYYGGQPPYPVPMGWPASPLQTHPYYGPPASQPMGPPQVRYPVPAPMPGPMPLPSPVDPSGYYGVPLSPVYPDHMRQRFDPRGASAMPPPQRPEPSPGGYGPDDFGDEDAPRIARRPSRSQRHEEDRKRMPPPQRPMSAMPQTSQPFHPPNAQRAQARQSTSRPPTSHRRSVGFADEYDYRDYAPSHERFQDISPEPSYDRRRYVDAPRRRGDSQLYEQCDVIPATARGRRASMYGTGALGRSGVSFEQEFSQGKYKDAMAYQEAISGSGSKMPLTAETLRKATRVPSSRSTRSSGSRDESEHRRSYTTGITRSSSGNGNEVTIKVDGAVLTVPAGAEITLSSRQSGSRYGSDRASTVYQLEDGRGRTDRQERMTLPHRSRAPSQSDSQGRGHLPPGYNPYDAMYPDGNYF
ncbi:hypothetical protein K4F52_009660 [Lecanicillium sp. MT-2017a]|nr:hypothetical protein K4F52_009660 [Lecanicillium sp. MT-2017a]